MARNGSYIESGCSNERDSTGYYIYRKDGERHGKCLGLDFEHAKQDYDGQGSCKTASKPCEHALLLSCVYLWRLFILMLGRARRRVAFHWL